MLNKEETTRLQLCYDAVVVGIGVLSPETIEWLVVKLKEVNDEAERYFLYWTDVKAVLDLRDREAEENAE